MPSTVRRVQLGSQGLEVSAQGLGCMGMSAFYGPPQSESDMIVLLRHAVASGVTFFDTSDIYGPHTNEILLGKALKGGLRERVQVATKFGISSADGKGNRQVRGDPAYVRASCEASLKRLDVDCIDLYYQHRIDPRVPIEITKSPCCSSHNSGATGVVAVVERCGGRRHSHILGAWHRNRFLRSFRTRILFYRF